ncbi:AAA family ATPase [Roseomonas mucosa]|uniref:AAA family ATPase n=1 Tax=Roseomonas mucosa TaxID=207340 RepID=UPI0028CE7456|nr:AAA family ATPase [Roseomonas mucosa]HWL81593.1 AAA family ATPase [Roseomonas sp.]MDT8288403.1 AAA family ATPase [Roseomonas mucosa]MDT8313249.1 AAA family ATPase [Roseomonas mucosa]MDT8349268.1 AAA family ATPase [Roseomonas mucosa]MDT8359245.1 AAA family ATPase [Roseomonas mucosa]
MIDNSTSRTRKRILNDDEANARYGRIRKRHWKAAKEGRHLPSVRELLADSPHLEDSVTADISAWCQRVLRRLKLESDIDLFVQMAIRDVEHSPDARSCLAAADLLRQGVGNRGYTGPDAKECANRAVLYAAILGDSGACISMAQLASRLAMDTDTSSAESADLTEQAMGWLSISTDARPVSLVGGKLGRWDDHRVKAAMAAHAHMRLLVAYFDGEAKQAEEGKANSEAEPRSPANSAAPRRRGMLRVPNYDCPEDLDAVFEAAVDDEETPVMPGIVVVRELGGTGNKEAKEALEPWKELVGKALPLPTVDVDAVPRSLRRLAYEFPHAVEVAEVLLRDLQGRETVRLRPTILVGAPGCGKSTFGRRLLELVGVRHQIYPCGGASDASIAGTPRRWHSGEPSMPVALARRYRTAAPGIILDEVEKVATGKHNGNLLDALLGMLEPESACRWLDPFLQAPVDLGHAIWLATANSLEGIPAPLRDRCRIIRFPSPCAEHAEALANHIIRRTVDDIGWHQSWGAPVDGVELAAIQQAWRGGSLRVLRRLVEGVLAARDQGMARA